MAKMPRNGDIRSWFGSSQASRPSASRMPASQTPVPASAVAPGQADLGIRDPKPEQQSSYIPSSPSVPEEEEDISISSSPPSVVPRRTYANDAVIAASDDEDGFASDDSDLPDVFNIGGPRKTTTSPLGKRPLNNPHETPRAKRTVPPAEFLFSSPLTIQSKKHKYDMAALLRMNEKDEETRASAQRFSALLEREKAEKEGRAVAAALDVADEEEVGGRDQIQDDESDASSELKNRMLQSATAEATKGGEESGAGTGKMRVVRALERTDVSGGRRAYYFFRQSEHDDAALTVGNAFPTEQAEGAWAILADTQDRNRHFQSGFPFDIQRMFGNMPDEIFLWILDELCHERRRDLAVEYVKLLRICEDPVRRLITPALTQRLFGRLGATKDVESLSSPVTLRDEVGDPYQDRTWICLENLLWLFGSISNYLTSEARATVMQILLRLGMDNVAVEHFGFAQEWRRTVDLVARSVPGNEWTSFCQDVCTSVYQSTEKATLRYRAIALLGPVQQPELPVDLQRRTLDLRRRLASVLFFDDLIRADKRPEDTINIRAVIDRIEDKPFIINAHTDYRELSALMMMLDIALGDASKQRIVTTPELSKDFDAQVDELAEGLKSMLTRVAPQNKGIHVSRIEAKSAMEMIRERLLYQVRSKKKPKIQGIRLDDTEEDASVPKQQEFMKGFFLKKGKKAVGFQGKEMVRTSIETEMVA